MVYLKMPFKTVVGHAIRDLADAGIRNEDIEAVQLFCQFLRESIDLFEIPEVDTPPSDGTLRAGASELLVAVGLGLLALLLVRGQDDDSRAGLGHGQRIPKADARRAAGDDGDASGEVWDLVEPEASAEESGRVVRVGEERSHVLDESRGQVVWGASTDEWRVFICGILFGGFVTGRRSRQGSMTLWTSSK